MTPVIKYGLRNNKDCQSIYEWLSKYDRNKDWNRKHYVRFNITNDTTVSEVKLIGDGRWIPSYPTDNYYNRSVTNLQVFFTTF